MPLAYVLHCLMTVGAAALFMHQPKQEGCTGTAISPSKGAIFRSYKGRVKSEESLYIVDKDGSETWQGF